MGDTVTVNGITVAVDDAGGDGVTQIVKLGSSTDGVSTVIAPATEGKQDSAIALLTSMDADTGSLAAAILDRAAVPAADQPGIPGFLAIRDDALSSISGEADEGEVTLPRVDGNGAVWMQLAGALSSAVDSVLLGYPAGATPTRRYFRATTAQTGADVWDPTLDYFVVKWYTITWSGANACRVTLWQGANADTTFSDGTDPVLFDMDLDANANGGVAFAFPDSAPWVSGTADHELHITTSANKTVSLTVGGYETD